MKLFCFLSLSLLTFLGAHFLFDLQPTKARHPASVLIEESCMGAASQFFSHNASIFEQIPELAFAKEYSLSTELLQEVIAETSKAQKQRGMSGSLIEVISELKNTPMINWRFNLKNKKLTTVISKERVAEALQVVDKKLLNESLFILPFNDGEARHGVNILKAINAPHLKVSQQQWGATLDKEGLTDEMLEGIKKVVIFEIPHPETEAALRAKGLEVIIIDHHFYAFAKDRINSLSSLEQLMRLIKWPVGASDLAFAINDRGYIPFMKRAQMTPDQISTVREIDLAAQKMHSSDNAFEEARREVAAEVSKARDILATIPKIKELFLLDKNYGVEPSVLKQEIAIKTADGIAHTMEISSSKIGFTGSPSAAQKLKKFDFTTLGYPSGSYSQYTAGSPETSMLFGFKPSSPPEGSSELVPPSVVEKMKEIILGELH